MMKQVVNQAFETDVPIVQLGLGPTLLMEGQVVPLGVVQAEPSLDYWSAAGAGYPGGSLAFVPQQRAQQAAD